MALEPKLEIKQSQSLLMTPQLRQAINLLQMSNLELNTLVENELASNPFLEREDTRLSEYEPDEKNIDAYDETPPQENQINEEEFSPDIDYDNSFADDYGSDREGYDVPENYGWQDYAQSKTAGHALSPDYDFFEQKLSSEKSLYDLINEQINLKFTAARDKIIAAVLMENLDDGGYFRGSAENIAARLKIPTQDIRRVLNSLKTFEPSGIFSQNLAECIAVQLEEKNRLDYLMKKLLNHLDLLGNKKYKERLKRLKINEEDLLSMIEDIKSVNPKPAADYHTTQIQYIIPDVFVRRSKKGGYTVELNNMSLPRLLINRQYIGEITRIGGKDKNTQRYLKTQLGNAGFLLKSLHQRAVTILRVTEEIVKAQYDFFEKGINHLKPLTLKTIAEAVEMHESTVSRVTTNKYVHTPLGIFELKYFFTTAMANYSGEDAVSSLSIKHKIKNLIDKETPDNILSDDKIAEILARDSIKIARRTVAKYRESLNIPTSSLRKKQKKL